MVDGPKFKECAGCYHEYHEDDLTKHPDIGDYFCGECYQEVEDDRRAERSDPHSDHYQIDGVGFADPGGDSALRAETPANPRNLPCPTCGEPNRLTPLDKQRGYQCDACANQLERGY